MTMFALLKLGKTPFTYSQVAGSSRASAEAVDEKTVAADDDDPETFLSHSYGYLRRTARCGGSLWAVPWVASTAVLSIICVALTACLYRSYHGTYERGFSTDFKSSVHFIEVEERRFTTPPLDVLSLDDLKTWDPSVPRYIGIPSPEVDQAWNRLTGDFMPVTAEEALDLPGAALQNGRYWTTTTVQHTLHCLNHICKSLYSEYYPQIDPESLDQWHHGT
ncbi:hypothetical protein F5Y15DRAFT_390817 [Xylariaceae sp. FL0016]|nr:hypothetical protein F5Y15DRAFT_390817 [Xylariaceae sp. FL0016]